MNLWWYLLLPALLLLFVFPFQIHGPINILDEGTWLATAQGLLENKVLYRDMWLPYGPILPLLLKAVFAFTPPTLAVVRGAFWVFNALGLLTVYACLLRFVRSSDLRIAFACFLAMVPLAAHVPTIPMSARYGAGFLALIIWRIGSSAQKPPAREWPVVAGVLAAFSFWVSQEVGLASLAASAYFYARHPRLPGAFRGYLIGAGSALAVGLFALSLQAGIQNYVQSAIVETRQVVAIHHLGFPRFLNAIYRQVQAGKLPWFVAGQQAGDVAAFYFPILLYLAVFLGVWFWRKRGEADRHTAISLAIYGILTASSAWGRSDRWHLYFSLSPALLLAAYAVDQVRGLRPRFGRQAALFVILLGGLLTVPHQWARSSRNEWLRTETRMTQVPRAGSVRLPFVQANGYEALVSWIQGHTAPGEPVLFFPYNGAIYFLADRPNPCRLPILGFAVTPAMQQEVIDELDHSRTRWVIWDSENTGFDGVPMDTYLGPLIQHIHSHFLQRETLGPFVFWERKST